MKKTQFSTSIFALATVFGAGFFSLPSIAIAQTAPGASTCDNLWWNCPVQNAPNVNQVLGAPVTATIDVNAGAIDVNTSPDPIEVGPNIVSTSSTAIGNAASAASANEIHLNFGSYQDISANVEAHNSILTTAPTANIISVTTANGNATQAQACCGGADIQSEQTMAATGWVKAFGYANTSPGVDTISLTSQANANIVGLDVPNGGNNNVTNASRQTNGGIVGALSEVIACCNNVVSYTNALAVANVATTVSGSASAYNWAIQNNTGYVDGVALHTVNSGTGIVVGAQAAGNNAGAYNKWGYTELNAQQTNDSTINSYAKLETNYYVDGAIVGSASQANSAIMSSIGSDGRTNITQTTTALGITNATTDFIGYSEGGVGTASASSSGNAMVGFVCSSCGTPGIGNYSDISQTNGGDNNATINMNNAGYGHTRAYGLAAGNSATIVTQNGGH